MYKVYFIDDTEFTDENILNSHWNEMPNKLIKKIEYSFCQPHIILEGFASYNQLIEKYKIIGQAQKERISKIILMGELNNEVFQVIYDCKIGKFSQQRVLLGSEYEGRKTTGWKKGQLQNPSIRLN